MIKISKSAREYMTKAEIEETEKELNSVDWVHMPIRDTLGLYPKPFGLTIKALVKNDYINLEEVAKETKITTRKIQSGFLKGYDRETTHKLRAYICKHVDPQTLAWIYNHQVHDILKR